ncbi:MAG: methylisocitrate lyase [Candidatus Binatia bacterium]|nr:MAG: methylisocitrate lyase [Candidatus Binatia bacterium]
MNQRERMHELLKKQRPLVMGGVYDGISTRLAQAAGFEALFIGGFSVAASLLGEPDVGYLTQTEMADTARRLCRLTDRPVLVDADTGYGGIVNVERTVELYYRAGAAGLFLEDQVWPKRCGHMRGKQVVETAEWVAKLRAVREHRFGQEMFLVARTDALAVHGIEEAIARARAAFEAGADAIFVEAPESLDQLERIGREAPGIKVANMVEFGRTPLLRPAELWDLGFHIIVTPLAPMLSAARALEATYQWLRQEGTLREHLDQLLPLARWYELVGYKEG